MRFLTVLTLVFSVSASAGEWATKKISFSPSTYTGGGTQHWYNCDSVEDTVEKHLEDLGATNISVRCSGGLDNGRFPSPAFVSGTFDAPVPTPEEDGVSAIVLEGRQSCSLNTEFLDYVLPMFSGATVISRRASCWGSWSDRWKYTIQLNH